VAFGEVHHASPFSACCLIGVGDARGLALGQVVEQPERGVSTVSSDHGCRMRRRSPRCRQRLRSLVCLISRWRRVAWRGTGLARCSRHGCGSWSCEWCWRVGMVPVFTVVLSSVGETGLPARAGAADIDQTAVLQGPGRALRSWVRGNQRAGLADPVRHSPLALVERGSPSHTLSTPHDHRGRQG
jgi:hypothetical protein